MSPRLYQATCTEMGEGIENAVVVADTTLL